MVTAMTTTEIVPDIAVIIPHYNDAKRLELCLTKLMQNDLGEAEILVVDNNSPTPPNHLHAQFPQVRFLSEITQGAGPTRNRGVLESQAPTLVFLDSDCVPDPDWLATARTVASKADLIGGRIDLFDETPPPRNGAEAFETVFGFDCRYYVEKQGFSVTANLITSRAAYLDTGPFRPVVAEDNDWCYRATAKGYKLIYADDLRVSHPTRSSWPELRRKWHRHAKEGYALQQSMRPELASRLRWGVKGLAMPASAIVHLPKLLFSPKLNSFGERLRGAATLVRLRCLRMGWMVRQTFGLGI